MAFLYWQRASFDRRFYLCVAAYVVVGFLTFGSVYNAKIHHCQIDVRRMPACESMAEVGSAIAGLVWPAYWPGEFSIWLFSSSEAEPK